MATTIRHIYSDGDVCTEGTPTRAALDRLDDAIRSAIQARYPDAEVEVVRQVRTSGGGRTSASADDYHDEDTIADEARELAGRAWETWVQGLTDADLGRCSVPECGRDVYAEERCEAHYRRARRGSASAAPVRARGTEPLRSLSLRVPASVHAALGDAPAATARLVLERWAKRARKPGA